MFQLLLQQPLVFVTWVFAFMLALAIHEFSHALVAHWLGDSTAERMGRLTLNPAAHVDPLGLLSVVLIGFGWGKPVPYNPYNLKWPKWGPVAIAFAGPTSNLLFAILSIVMLAILEPRLGDYNLLVIFFLIASQLNIALLAFNLVPLPPLDGSKVLLAALSHPKYQAIRQAIEIRGPMVLLGLVLADSFLNLGIFSWLFGWTALVVHRLAGFIHL